MLDDKTQRNTLLDMSCLHSAITRQESNNVLENQRGFAEAAHCALYLNSFATDVPPDARLAAVPPGIASTLDFNTGSKAGLSGNF